MSEYLVCVCDFCDRQLRAGERTTRVRTTRTTVNSSVWRSDDNCSIDVCDDCAARVTLDDVHRRYYQRHPLGPESPKEEAQDAAE